MSANTFGSKFKITTFGESHGNALGVVIDGCPSGVKFDFELLKKALVRRRPGGELVSSRNESDSPEILSGIYQDITLGTPITIIVRNEDARSMDYENVKPKDRKGHADDLWLEKFGHSDPRGGGRASGRETVSRVMAGAVAQMFLKQVLNDFAVIGFAKKIGTIEITETEARKFAASADDFPARLPSPEKSRQVEELLTLAKKEGKSYGGVAEIWVQGLPQGLGQPVFHKLKADLASAFFGVGATSAVEIGPGFSASVVAEGTEFHAAKENYGGIRGGISTGEQIRLQVTFKPTSSVLDIAKKGRHDPCIVPRAIPVLEAMCALVIADHVLWKTTDTLASIKRSLQ